MAAADSHLPAVPILLVPFLCQPFACMSGEGHAASAHDGNFENCDILPISIWITTHTQKLVES